MLKDVNDSDRHAIRYVDGVKEPDALRIQLDNLFRALFIFILFRAKDAIGLTHEQIAPPKDVQELLGHSDVSTTMNIYAHSTRKAKRDSARLLDKVASNA